MLHSVQLLEMILTSIPWKLQFWAHLQTYISCRHVLTIHNVFHFVPRISNSLDTVWGVKPDELVRLSSLQTQVHVVCNSTDCSWHKSELVVVCDVVFMMYTLVSVYDWSDMGVQQYIIDSTGLIW